MGSLPSPKQLPVINLCLNNLDTSSSSWVTKCDEVTRALEEYGCFIAVYDGVSQKLHDSIVVASKEAFALPDERKALNTMGKQGLGYQRAVPSKPLFERLSIQDATTPQGAERFTNLMWPSGNPSFCESALSFAKVLADLEVTVMRMVAKTLGVEQDYEKLLASTTYVFKFIKYLIPPAGGNRLGIFAHTDKGFMTIIKQQEDGKGLEIMTKDGEWIEVDFNPSSFIVMAADACTAWSNGRIKGAVHRVMLHGNKERISLTTSSFIRDRMVEVPQGLVNEDQPLKFKPFDHYKYIEYHNNNTKVTNGERLDETIRFYCGI